MRWPASFSTTERLEWRVLLTTVVEIVNSPETGLTARISVSAESQKELTVVVSTSLGLLRVTENGTEIAIPDTSARLIDRLEVTLQDITLPPTESIRTTADLSAVTAEEFPRLATDTPSIQVTGGATLTEQVIIGSPLNDHLNIAAAGFTFNDFIVRGAKVEVRGGLGDDLYDVSFGEELQFAIVTAIELDGQGNDTLKVDGGGNPDSLVDPADPSKGLRGVDLKHSTGGDRPAGTLEVEGAEAGLLIAAPGEQSFETIIGSNANDHFQGSADSPRMYELGAANDTMVLFAGDTVKGGNGNDTYVVVGNERDEPTTAFIEEFAEQGTDLLSFEEALLPADGPGVMVDLQQLEMASFVNAQGAKFSVRGIGASQFRIEDVDGSPRPDVILGNLAKNRLNGGGGGDVISGRDGDDHIKGGAGMDYLHGGFGKDEVVGGSGADVGLDIGEETTIAADVTVDIVDLVDPIVLHGATTYIITAENRGEDVATGTSVMVTPGSNIAVIGPTEFSIGGFIAPPNYPAELPTPDMFLPAAPQFLVTAGQGNSTGMGSVNVEISALEGDPVSNNKVKEQTVINGGGHHNQGQGGPVRHRIVNVGRKGATTQLDADYRGFSGQPETIIAAVLDGLFEREILGNDRDNFGKNTDAAASTLEAGVVQGGGTNRAVGVSNPVRADITGAGVGGEGDAHDVSISDDGRFVAITSDSRLLSDVPDLNDATDVFLKDMVTGELITISKAADGALTADAASARAVVSPDGRWVAFHSSASNLIDGFVDNNDPVRDADVFLFDRLARTTQLVSVSTTDAGARTTGANGRSRAHYFSADGRFLVFHSQASDLVAGFVDQNGTGNGINADLYVYDTLTQATQLVSVGLDGVSGGDASVTNSFDHVSVGLTDERLTIAFEADAKNLQNALPDTTSGSVIFVREFPRDLGTGAILAGATRAVSLNAAGTEVREGRDPVLTPDGLFLTYTTTAGDSTDVTDGSDRRDLIQRNLSTGVNTLLTVSPTGEPGDDHTFGHDTSDDGRYVLFKSRAGNLVDGFVDGNGTGEDLFVRDTVKGVTTLITVSTDGATSANSFAGGFGITGNGEAVYFESRATDLVENVIDTNNGSNLFSSFRHVYQQYNQPEGGGDDTLTLSLDGDDLVLTSDRDGEVSREALEDNIGIRIIGTDAHNEQLILDFSNGVFDIDDIFFDGGAGGTDSILITGADFDSVEYTHGTGNSGSVAFSNGVVVPLVYTNAGPITDETAAAHRTLSVNILDDLVGAPVDLTLRVTDAGGEGAVQVDNDGRGLFQPFRFAAPTQSLTIETGDADDTVVVDSLAGVPVDGVLFNGNDGTDSLTLPETFNTVVQLALGQFNSGVFDVDGRSLRFEQVENIADSFAATTREVLLPNSPQAKTVLIRDSIGTAGVQQITSGNGSFSTISFTVPTEALTITGSPQADNVLVESLDPSFGGDLTLTGEGGRDRIDARAVTIPVTISGGAARDFLFGGPGGNRILGGDGGDRIFGNTATDRINGNRGSDVIYAMAGRDIVNGGRGNDVIVAGRGNDVIAGNEGNDSLNAGKGNDRLLDGPGNDVLTGGSGADLFDLSARGRDVVDDAAGRNTLRFVRAAAEVIVDLDRTGERQTISPGVVLELSGRFRDFVGSPFADELFADFLPDLTRRLDGVGSEDKVTIDAGGATVTRVGNTVHIPNFAPIDLFSLEDEDFV